MKRHRVKRSLFANPPQTASHKASGPPPAARTAPDAAPNPDRQGGLPPFETETQAVAADSIRHSPPAAPVLLSVSELTHSIKTVLEARFATVRVWGEISNVSPSRSGTFFTLKDSGASIDGVIWKRDLPRIAFTLEEGLEVEVTGELDVYPPRGEYKVVVRDMLPRGQGALQLAFEQLKRRLQNEGLFDRPRQPLPALPHRIAVVTSRDGAAWHDFTRVTHRRNPHLDIYLLHSRVQGDGAAEELLRALSVAGRWRDAGGRPFDLVVLTRGGGSLEDLWAFNDEALGRAIAAAPLPVVSAVGHEVDWTIADFLADLRAPTPSAAGEMVTPEWRQLHRRLLDDARRAQRMIASFLATRRDKLTIARTRLEQHNPRRRLQERRAALPDALRRMQRFVTRQVASSRVRIENATGRLIRLSPRARVVLARAQWRQALQKLRTTTAQTLTTARSRWESATARLHRAAPVERLRHARQTLDRGERRFAQTAARTLRRHRDSLAQLAERLEALSPLAILRRGYSVTYDADGRILTSAEGVQAEALLRSRLATGSLWSRVVAPPAVDDAE